MAAMDTTLPLISIVTPSYNQGEYIARTIESVRAQSYPRIEHIIVDGLSTDATADVLSAYPDLRVLREKDRGQADAINKGMALATGDILAFLNSDDVLYPGALEAVARAFQRDTRVDVVMGRCRFIDADDRFTGIEHPSAFTDADRVLAIWKGHAIPQPSVFWSRRVWEACGPLDITEQLVLDYDLFCRMALRFDFTVIDTVLSGYRLQPQSKTSGASDAERLLQSVRVSRRYWGRPWTWRFLRLAASWWLHRLGLQERARRLLLDARRAWEGGQFLKAAALGAPGGLVLPQVAFYGLVYPRLFRHAPGGFRAALRRVAPRSLAGTPQGAAYHHHEDVWPDGWAGPILRRRLVVEGRSLLRISGWVDATYLPEDLGLEVSVNGELACRLSPDPEGGISAAVDLAGAAGATTDVVIRATASFTPHAIWRNGDYRPLSWRVTGIAIEPVGAAR